MSDVVAGVSLERLGEPVRPALEAYEEISGGEVQFDTDVARTLELTPDKPNSARSVSDVYHKGEQVSSLYVIAFAPGDGTGDENTYTLDEVLPEGTLPLTPKVIPRSKSGIHSEAHLAIASFFPYSPEDSDAIMFGNSLELLGLRAIQRLQLRAILGQSHRELNSAAIAFEDLEPTATFTTGHREETDERFGDPHAVYNREQFVQVAGFIAIKREVAKQHASTLTALGAVGPRLQL